MLVVTCIGMAFLRLLLSISTLTNELALQEGWTPSKTTALQR